MTVAFRATATCVLVAIATALGACGSNSSPRPGPSASPTLAPQSIGYTAIGASDAVGIGASVPCGTVFAAPTCPGGTGYVPVLAGLLAAGGPMVKLNDLGISGAVIGPDVRALGNMYGSAGTPGTCQPRTGNDVIPGDFITNEVPSLTGAETLVTIFGGGNDTNAIVNALGCGAGGTTAASQQQFIATWITNFGTDFQQLVGAIKAKAPKAKIVIANLPNFALIPVGAAQSAPVRAALAAVSVGIDQNVLDQAPQFGVPVVDLLCDSRSYVTANFSSDGFHPDDAGYLIFAQSFQAQIQSASPAAPNPNCNYASQSATVRAPDTQAIPAFERGR